MSVLDSVFPGQTSTTTSSTTPQPTQAQSTLQNTLANQITSGLGTLPGGGLPGYTQFQPSAVPGYNELGILGQIQSAGQNPQLFQPIEQFGLNQMQMSADPTQRLAAAQRAYEGIAAPTITNNLNAYGQGRSGALLQALNENAVNNYALPILNDVANKQFGFGQAANAMGPQIENRTFARLQAALQAAGAPRQAFNAEYMRPFSGILNLLGGPGTGGGGATGSTTTQTTNTPTNWMGQVFAPIIASILAGGR